MAQGPAVRQVQIEPGDLDPGAGSLDIDRVRRAAVGGDLLDLGVEALEPLHHGLELGDLGIARHDKR